MDLDAVRFSAAPFTKPVFKLGVQYSEGEASGLATDFSTSLKSAMNNLNDVQSSAKTMMQDFASGGDIEVHEVMMGIEKADISMNLALQVRNKILEGYNDIIRMQI